MNSSLKKYLAGILIAVIAASCAHFNGDQRTAGVVIERNKQTRPAWVDSPTSKLIANSGNFRFHYALVKQRDLAIAVKLSQTNAVDTSYDLWRPEFDRAVSDFVPVKRLIASSRASKELGPLMDMIAHKVHSDIAQIEDIYYERIRIDDPKKIPELAGVSEYFDVHALLTIQSIDKERLRSALATGMMESKNAEVKKVGRELSTMAKTAK